MAFHTRQPVLYYAVQFMLNLGDIVLGLNDRDKMFMRRGMSSIRFLYWTFLFLDINIGHFLLVVQIGLKGPSNS